MDMIFFRQFFLLTADELKQLFFRKRVLFTLFMYAGTLLFTFWVLSRSYDFLLTSMDEIQIPPEQKVMLQKTLNHLSFPREMTDRFPILSFPFPLLIYFFVSLSTLPFLTGIISCDMISQDLSRGTQRFLLFRVSRAAYYWSKAVSHFLFYFIIQWALFGMLFVLVVCDSKKIPSFSFFHQGMNLTLRLIPLLLCFLAYTQIISSQFATSAKSYLVNQAGLVLMLLILMIQPVFSFFYSPLWSGLFYSYSFRMAQSFGGFALWAIFFWGTGYFLFHRKRL
jgi:hypothetical protein